MATPGDDGVQEPTGRMIGMESFGASAPLKELTEELGCTTEHIVAAAKEQQKK